MVSRKKWPKIVLDDRTVRYALGHIKTIIEQWERGQLTLSETHSFIRREMTNSYDRSRLVETDKRRIKKHKPCGYVHCPHIGYDSRGRDIRDLQ